MHCEIVAVGGSAGGLEALLEITRNLPQDFPAPVFVVIHIPGDKRSFLADIIAQHSSLPATQVYESQSIEGGHIYVAYPDTHLLIEGGRVFPWRGPKEDHHRPAINPLFRSAAEAYGPQAVGIVLSGGLQDGSAGLWSIKQRGGIAIVQNPETAIFPDMPESVLEYVIPDFVLEAAQIAPLLDNLCSRAVNGDTVIAVESEGSNMETRELIETRCPDCQGPLSEVRRGDFKEFSCVVGHTYSLSRVLQAQGEAEENILWGAVASLRESIALMRRVLPDLPPEERAGMERRIEKRIQLADETRSVIERLDSLTVK